MAKSGLYYQTKLKVFESSVVLKATRKIKKGTWLIKKIKENPTPSMTREAKFRCRNFRNSETFSLQGCFLRSESAGSCGLHGFSADPYPQRGANDSTARTILICRSLIVTPLCFHRYRWVLKAVEQQRLVF